MIGSPKLVHLAKAGKQKKVAPPREEEEEEKDEGGKEEGAEEKKKVHLIGCVGSKDDILTTQGSHLDLF